jgi:hypothetical protein
MTRCVCLTPIERAPAPRARARRPAPTTRSDRARRDRAMHSQSSVLLQSLLLIVGPAADAAADAPPVLWKSAQELTVINAGPWPVSEPQAGGMLRRLPFAAKGVVRASIYGASADTAGLAVRFRSSARMLLINASVTSAGLDMAHMPATGESGFDLYCWDAGSRSYRWLALWTTARSRPWSASGSGSLTGAVPLPALAAGATREFILYLPLYNGVAHVSVGAEGGAGASLLPAPRPAPRPAPVVFYGTSITQGGVAIGLARTVALHYCSSDLYQIRLDNGYLLFF